MKASEVDELLEEAERSGWRLHRTLKNYLQLLDLETQDGNGNGKDPDPRWRLAPEDALSAVRERVRVVAVRHRRPQDPRLYLELPAAPLAIHRNGFETMIEEPLDNAFRYSQAGCPVEVRLTREGAYSVQDRGRGMTAAQLGQIGAFQQFDRQRYEQQGLGLGLSLVQKLARHFKARFSLQSEPEKGTLASIAFCLTE